MLVYSFHHFICLNALSKNQRFLVSAWRYFGVVPKPCRLATRRGSRWTWSGWRVVWFEKTAKCVTYAFRSVNPFLNSYNCYRLLRILYPEFETHVPMYRYAQKNWHKQNKKEWRLLGCVNSAVERLRVHVLRSLFNGVFYFFFLKKWLYLCYAKSLYRILLKINQRQNIFLLRKLRYVLVKTKI